MSRYSAVEIIWTKHAKERQEQWERKLGITCQEVEDLLLNPEQVVPGSPEGFVAQTRRGSGLLRVPFIEVERGRKILTVYWTTKAERYWEGEWDANTI